MIEKALKEIRTFYHRYHNVLSSPARDEIETELHAEEHSENTLLYLLAKMSVWEAGYHREAKEAMQYYKQIIKMSLLAIENIFQNYYNVLPIDIRNEFSIELQRKIHGPEYVFNLLSRARQWRREYETSNME